MRKKESCWDEVLKGKHKAEVQWARPGVVGSMHVRERAYILKNPIDYDMKLVLYNLNVMEGQWIILYDFYFLNDYSGCRKLVSGDEAWNQESSW